MTSRFLADSIKMPAKCFPEPSSSAPVPLIRQYQNLGYYWLFICMHTGSKRYGMLLYLLNMECKLRVVFVSEFSGASFGARAATWLYVVFSRQMTTTRNSQTKYCEFLACRVDNSCELSN